MKTRIIILMTVAVFAMGLTSCEKSETKTLKITAKALRSADKASISGSAIMWEDGDIININGTGQEVRIDGNGFSVSAGDAIADSHYFAAFPYNGITFNSNGTSSNFRCNLTNLPYSVGEPIIPMFAHTSSGTLEFSTPYAVIALSINDGGTFYNHEIGSIVVTGTNCGQERDISFAENNLSMTPYGSESDNYNYNIHLPDGPCTIYIPIPPCTGVLHIGDDFEANREVTFIANTIYNIALND
ncbi:MAG: hypothetical protein J6X62_03880 [Bacteroidales bacterium]|nr:hypothetical protein [Bacteroidales bacterium]